MELALTHNAIAIIDDEDYCKTTKYHWYIDSSGYARCSTEGPKIDGKRTRIYIHLHRLLTNAPKGMEVDHINGNKLDNRKSNLRICTRQQNSFNMGVFASGSSGYKGVTYSNDGNRRKRWMASVVINGKHKTIGRFLTKEEAAKAHDVFAKLYHGEFARLNFPE